MASLLGEVKSVDALLICGNADESAILCAALQRAGLSPLTSATVANALERWQERPVDMIVLASPGKRLAEHVRRLRQESEVPMVVITDPQSEDALCEAYAAGADEVIVRPYSPRLTIMRIRAILRRGKGTVLRQLPNMTVGDLTLDPTTRIVKIEGYPPRRLTQLEFRLLYALMLNRDQILPTATLIEQVWGYTGAGTPEMVRNLVSRLRSKVEHPREARHIVTEPGIGYRLVQTDK